MPRRVISSSVALQEVQTRALRAQKGQKTVNHLKKG
jgi:hypothetical protein